jgi:TolB protein
MKRCPECRRDYYDDTLLYCLDDGNSLLEGPASVDEPVTAILQITDAPSESATRAQINTTDERKVNIPTTSSAEYVVTEIKRHKLFAFGVVVLLAFTGIGFGIYKYSAASETTAAHFTSPQNLKFTRLISGQISKVQLSPDGRFAAYAVPVGGDKSNIRLRQIATTTDVEIVAPTDGRMIALNFSPNGDYLYYILTGEQGSAIYRVSTLGGPPARVADKLQYYNNAAVSPDGKILAYTGEDRNKKESSLLLANADGSDERTLVKFSDSRSFGYSLAWSPDGKTIASNIQTLGSTEKTIKIVGFSIADGSQRQLSDQDWERIPSIVWLPDGNLIGSGNKKNAESRDPRQLWLIGPNAEPRPITNDVNGYGAVSATAKGDVLLATTQRNVGNLWTVPNNDAAHAAEVPSSSEVSLVSWTADNKFLYTSRASDIWTMNADGSNQKQLTANQGANVYPSMTADGRYIVFMSDRVNGIQRIFRMDPDGRNQTQLTSGIGDWWPRLSTDGKWVYYAASTPEDQPSTICKVPIEGGEPVIVAKFQGAFTSFDISPRDGTIAYRQTEKGEGKAAEKIIIIPPGGGDPIKTLTIPPTSSGFLRWTPDGRSIAFLDTRNNGANIWAVPLDGKTEAKPLTDFKNESSQVSFAWSPDGKQLAVIRGTSVTDAVLITEAK